MTVDCDLAVIGGGPAGAAAALRARRLAPDRSVVLIDRVEFPRDKACGDGIGPEALALIDRLGVSGLLDDYPPVDRVRITAPDGTQMAGRAPRPGRVVPRSVLDDRLRTAALRAGARPLRHHVREVRPVAGGVRVDDALTARWVVGADGANSRVRRSVGADRQPPAHRGLAMRGYAAADGLEELSITFVSDRWPAYAWAFPTGRGLVNVGYGPFDARRVGSRQELVRTLERLAPREPDPDSLRAHHLPLSTSRPRVAHGRVLLAGDAASLINPLTGEGIAYALLSGALAGAAAVRFPATAHRVYPGALERALGRHLRHTTAAATLFRWRFPVTLSVGAGKHSPGAFADLCEFALGTGLITSRIAAGMTAQTARVAAAYAAGQVRAVPESSS